MALSMKPARMVDIIHELPALFLQHWLEAAADTDKIILEPDWKRYLDMDAAGQLFILVVRDEDHKLCGYFFATIFYHIHYCHTLTAFSDGYYIVPEKRVAGHGVRLLKLAEKHLKDLGVSRMYISCGLRLDLSELLGRLGFTHTENGFSKFL